ncbi:MAG TPA: TlpA disulfide reductase family protein [Candidatus Limnocylindria bacterium]|nr:TlpA disulfide reductase family protein [Candidatus Limnocylindria bacterium]
MNRAPSAARLLVGVTLLLAGCAPSAVTDRSNAPSSDAPGSVVPSERPSEPAASVPPSAAAEPSDEGIPQDPLLARELVDVRTGGTVTLGELAAERPVIVELMAIWCTNCRAQMHELVAAHDLADFATVGIDIDPSEVAGDLAAYAEREGFDWPFVLADPELATLLRDRFGNEALFPPSTPKLLVGTDGSVELLPLGQHLAAAEIADLVGG